MLVAGTLITATQVLPLDRWMESARVYVNQHTVATLIVLFCVLCFGSSCFAPIALISTIGCFFFGWSVGFPVCVAANFAGALFTFAVGRRYLLQRVRDVIDEIGPEAQLFAIMIERHPWTVGLSLRLSVLPFTFKNYIGAALPFAPLPFAVTALFGDLPYMCIFASIGTSVGMWWICV